jgi:hypothetical protein
MRLNWRISGLTVALVSALILAACDFEVVNPGPVQDENVNLAGAHRSLVNGAIRRVQDALGIGYVGENIVHGITPSGHTGTGGTSNEEELAILTDESNGDNGLFSAAQEARWIGEEAIRRFTGGEAGVQDPDSYRLLGEAYLWAGLANRVLGESMCTAVRDGGPAEPKLKHFEWAVPHFDKAEQMAKANGWTDIEIAAIGARAAAKLWLKDAAGARADAMKVPFDFKFTTDYKGSDHSNYTFSTVMSFAFQSASHWGTPMHTHFLTTGDLRAAWGYDNGSLPPYPTGKNVAVRGQTHPARQTWVALVPLYYPLKGYAPRKFGEELRFFAPDVQAQRHLNLNIVTGREMALVIAETYLMDGDWQTAMEWINKVRTSTPVYAANLAEEMNLTLHPDEARDAARVGMPNYFTGTPGDFSAGGNMPPVVANSLEEAWAALKFERYLETNLEGRRLGDRWRWRENNTPGALHPLEFLPQQTANAFGVPTDPLNLCFPLPRGEKNANTNIEVTYRDWTGP